VGTETVGQQWALADLEGRHRELRRWVSDGDQDVFNARGEHVGYVFQAKTVFSLTGDYLGGSMTRTEWAGRCGVAPARAGIRASTEPAVALAPRANKPRNTMAGWADPLF